MFLYLFDLEGSILIKYVLIYIKKGCSTTGEIIDATKLLISYSKLTMKKQLNMGDRYYVHCNCCIEIGLPSFSHGT